MMNQNVSEVRKYPFTASNGVVVTIALARTEYSKLPDDKHRLAVGEALQVCGKPSKETENGLAVSDKGAVSIYGYGRFPITIYADALLKLLDRAAEIRAFIEKHRGSLKFKQ